MKKLAIAAACIFTVIAANTAFIFAETGSVNTSTSGSQTASSQTASSQTTSTQQTNTTTAQPSAENQSGSTATAAASAGIIPGSPLYAFDKMMESIQFALTFSNDGKAEVLVSFANERLAEASVLNDKSKMELLEDIMKAYIEVVEKANEQIKEAAEEGKDVQPLIQEIKLAEDSAQKITISIKGEFQPETAEQLKSEVFNIVKETLVVEAFATAKANFFEAKKQLELARKELKEAMESKDEALIKAAREKLALAEKNKDELELVKDLIEVKKEAVKDEIGVVREQQEEEEKDVEKAGEKAEKKIEKLEEKAEKEAEKAKEKAERAAEKAEEKAEKIKEKAEKEAEKAKEKSKKAKGKSEDDHDND